MKKVLIVILVFVVFGAMVFFIVQKEIDKQQAAQSIKENQKIEKQTQTTADSNLHQQNPQAAQKSDESEDLQTFTSENLGISFRYPKGWYAKEEESINRIYIRNFQGDIGRENMPSNFEQVWISTWEQEVTAETENNVKAGNPNGKEFGGSLVSDKINRNGFVINTYEYKTIGGPILQAFWNDKNGKRYYATNSTEVGQENQQSMIENLRLILSTVEFTK